ncbi:MAG: leucine-rich repeat domain-containing protein, partial [Clostridia bacterium]|nr:leucine-rich repeat domain-containing protein [Clostridia bacterium]
RGCAALTDVVLPEEPDYIDTRAFYECRSLPGVTIPASVTSIRDGAFQTCDMMTGVIIPHGVESIGSNAFSGCLRLTGIVIPNTVTSTGWSIFYYCADTCDVFFEGTEEEWNNFAANRAPFNTNVTLYFNATMPTMAITAQPENAKGEDGDKVRFTVTAEGVELSYRWQLSDDGGMTWRNSSGREASYTTTLSAKNDGRYVRCVVTDKYGHKQISETAYMRLAASVVTITGQPVDCAVKIGQPVSFTVTAEGKGLTYLWQLSDDKGEEWRDSSGKTATYATTLTEKNNGRYVRCVVTDSYGDEVISDPAVMTELAACVTKQPVSVIVGSGEKAEFSVEARGEELTYQWQLSDDMGETWRNSSTRIATYSATVTEANNGRYVRCVVTDKKGNTDISDEASMTLSMLKILANPANVTAEKGKIASFTVVAAGEGLKYQWQLSDDEGQNWRNSKTKEMFYRALLTETNDGRWVRCVVTNKDGVSQITSPASMKLAEGQSPVVNEGPSITKQPADQTGDIGTLVKFNVTATGDGLTYQWQLSDDEGVSWRNSSNKTAEYATTLSNANNGRYVRCVVTDKNGKSVNSAAASMKVGASQVQSPVITQQPTDQTGEIGELVKFNVTATGEELTYQWQLSDDQGKNWRNSSNKTAEYATTLSDANNGRYVRCVVTDKNGQSVNSAPASMKVVSPQGSRLAITKQPANQTGAIGTLVKFSVTATGEGLTYQWQLSDDQGQNWRNSSNQTAEYSTTLSDKNNGRYVRCIVTDKNGQSVNSAPASMKVQ